ncbi:MAG: ADP-heptose--LPS heptosyltransferase [Alphaproteobacteria bacterium]|nr:ADP-heptose--LPS heptosyltransferase [Alphaproteobacteria bacterium]
MAPILVIKLGALGDFILSYRAMTAIRAHHRDAALALLTIPSLAPLARATGLFDDIWCDDRPKAYQPAAWLRLARRLNGAGFVRVYDLQTNDRTGHYFRLMGWPFAARRPEWSGIVRGCSHRHDAPDRTNQHTLERQADQLAVAGIGVADYPPLDLSWVPTDLSRHGFAGTGKPFALLVPGGSAGHPEKRWPAACYGALAAALAEKGVTPVIIGTAIEAGACAETAAATPAAVNLCGDSPILDTMALARQAALAVGNDTGPMHLIAAMGCSCVSLFSASSSPVRNRPRGPYEGPGAIAPPSGRRRETVTVLQESDLGDLALERVLAALPVS